VRSSYRPLAQKIRSSSVFEAFPQALQYNTLALNVYTDQILNNWKGSENRPPMSLDLKRQFIVQLIESSRLLRNYIDQRAKRRGTTRAQWIVLFRLRQQEGLSQVDLAEVLELQPISLVRLLDRLVEHGLLERRSDPKDRRANRLFLTASGRQLVDELDSLRDAIATDVLQDVPVSAIETSLKTLRDIKERIKGAAEQPANIAAE
jgi:MarR family transcriptional regulator for hemolysin